MLLKVWGREVEVKPSRMPRKAVALSVRRLFDKHMLMACLTKAEARKVAEAILKEVG